jgi:hypothetical protein
MSLDVSLYRTVRIEVSSKTAHDTSWVEFRATDEDGQTVVLTLFSAEGKPLALEVT